MYLKRFLIFTNKLLKRVEEITLCIAVIFTFIILIINVIARQLGMSIYYADELAMFSIIIITFIGLSNAARNGRHIRMAAIADISPTKVQKFMMIISTIINALISFYLSYLSFNYVYTAYKWGQVTPALRMPYWISIAIVPIGLFFTGLQYVFSIIKNIQDKENVWVSAERRSEYE